MTRSEPVKGNSPSLLVVKVCTQKLLSQASFNESITRLEPDWVTAQTIERRRRLLEEADSEYEEKLAKARKKESVLRKMAAARERKRAVSRLDHSSFKRIDNSHDIRKFLILLMPMATPMKMSSCRTMNPRMRTATTISLPP